MAKPRICHTTTIVDSWPITLIQQGKDRFTVTYGKQTTKDLNYSQAAYEYGACIMHALACEDLLDNESRTVHRAAFQNPG